MLREEVLRFDRYQEQFSYLMKKRIETAEQLSMQYDALQAEIDALTDRRSELYKMRRSGRGGDGISEEIAGLTRQLRPLRRELKLCARIEGDIPKVETSVRRAAKEHSKEKALEKPSRSLERFSKIMRKKEARTGIAGQGGGRRRADARQGRQRSHAIPGPLNFSQYF